MKTMSYLVLLLFLICSAWARTRSSQCLRQLDKNPELFEPCRNNKCLLFKETHPTVDLGFKPHPPEGVPWRCRIRHQLYSNVKGTFFDFIDMISELDDAYCVYDESCSFDDLTKVLIDTEKSSFQWIAAGGLFLVKYRITPNSLPSMPFYGGKIQVFGARATGIQATGKHVAAVVSALSLQAWIFVLVVFILLFVLRALLIHQFGLPLNRIQAWWAMLGEPFESRESSRKEDKILLDFYLSWWTKIFLAATATIVLWFELGVVGFIFDPNSFVLDVRIQNLKPHELKQFAVVSNSAEEYYFRLMSGQEQNFLNGSVPWVACKDSAQVFEAILNGTARYGITYEHYGKYFLRKQGACSRFLLYDTRDLTQQYLSGWYFSRGVNSLQRTTINGNISMLRDLQRFNEKIFAVVPHDDDPCGQQPRGIQVILLLITVGLLVFPFVLIILCILIYHSIVRNCARELHLDENAEQWADPQQHMD